MAAPGRGPRRQRVSPGRQRHCRGWLAAALTEVPLVDGELDVESEEELVFGEERGYAPHYGFVEAARRHERVKSLVNLLL